MFDWLRRRRSSRPVYQPLLTPLSDGAYEQRFTARNVLVETEDDFVILGFSDDQVGAIHGLIFTSPAIEPFTPHEIYVEWNDQGNACNGSEIALSFDGTELLIEFDSEADLTTGRISYEARADPLTDPEEDYAFPLQRLRISFSLTPELRAAVSDELRRLARNGMRVGVTD